MTMTASAAHVFGGKVIYSKCYKNWLYTDCMLYLTYFDSQKVYVKKPLFTLGYSRKIAEILSSDLVAFGNFCSKSI